VCVSQHPEPGGNTPPPDAGGPAALGPYTADGVLEAAKIHRAHALLALTSSDTTNLEGTLYARTIKPDLRVALRLYDDDFATAVYRTLRTAHPDALTRSRSVTHLAAPAFAGAMMGRQILGAIPVERKVLLFAALLVAAHPGFEGRTVSEAFRPGAWRVLALDTASPAARRPDLASAPHAGERPQLLWDLHPGYVLRPEDRVVIAATRRGLAELLGRHPSDAARPTDRGVGRGALRGGAPVPVVGTYRASMTTAPEGDPVEPGDVRAARSAIEAYLSRAAPEGEHHPPRGADRPEGERLPRGADGPAGGERRIDDATAERIAREAWDAVSAATPPPPDPDSDAGPARMTEEPAEVTERRNEAIAIARGLRLLGYHLDETLRPGPDMAAG
ncbi:NAD-binding protein, partial [Streptomyces sp. NPDC058667]|uniref:NAD-binding protein n=1 Tax=Streptomyces sp. NPDC058667 TaxID=3346588 RepID=UPI0036463E99